MLELLTPAKTAFQHVSCGTGWMGLWYSLDLGRAKSATTYARLGGLLGISNRVICINSHLF